MHARKILTLVECKCSLELKLAIVDFMVVGEAFGFDESNMGKAWTMREFGVLLSKIQTNNIDGSQYIASTSMFNHSCDNNIAWSPNDPTKTLIVTRPIVVGEEVYYRYGPKDDLKEYFGFDCRCLACRPKSDSCNAVDERDKRSADDV
jgi:hypothetical protein